MANKLDKVVELNAIQWDCLKVKTFWESKKKKKRKRNNQRITISFSHPLKWPFVHSTTDTNRLIDEYMKSDEMNEKEETGKKKENVQPVGNNDEYCSQKQKKLKHTKKILCHKTQKQNHFKK